MARKMRCAALMQMAIAAKKAIFVEKPMTATLNAVL